MALPTKAASGRQRTASADRKLPARPSHVTPTSKSERILACREWAHRAPVLGKFSDKHLRFLAKDFFTAGWTIRDLITALDSLPDGRAHGQLVDGQWVPYSGADGISAARLGHWVNWRLNAWRDNGTVVESPTQTRIRRAVAAKNQRQAQQPARDEERQRNPTEMATPEGQSAKQACLDQFRANSERNRNLRRRR